MEAIYGHVEHGYRSHYELIPQKPEILHKALESLFDVAAKAVETRIAKIFTKGLVSVPGVRGSDTGLTTSGTER